jgi:hypothetical protein
LSNNSTKQTTLSTDPAIYLSTPDLLLDRRMSTISVATSDSSSRAGDKRLLTPEDSPLTNGTKRVRPTIHLDGAHSPEDAEFDGHAPHSSVQLPSVQAFDDAYHRRYSLPTDVLARQYSNASATPLRSAYPSSSSNSPLPSYTFPPPQDDMNGDRPQRLDTNLDPNSFGQGYPQTAITPGGTYYGPSPISPE